MWDAFAINQNVLNADSDAQLVTSPVCKHVWGVKDFRRKGLGRFLCVGAFLSACMCGKPLNLESKRIVLAVRQTGCVFCFA